MQAEIKFLEVTKQPGRFQPWFWRAMDRWGAPVAEGAGYRTRHNTSRFLSTYFPRVEIRYV